MPNNKWTDSAGGGNPTLGGPTSQPTPKAETGGGGSYTPSPYKKPKRGGGRWRGRGRRTGGAGRMSVGPARSRQGNSGGRGGGRRGTPERQAIHAQRQADRRSGARPKLGRRDNLKRGLQAGINRGGPMGGGIMGAMGGAGALGSKGGGGAQGRFGRPNRTTGRSFAR